MRAAEHMYDGNNSNDVKLTALINWMPDEIFERTIQQFESEGMFNSEEVNTKFLLI